MDLNQVAKYVDQFREGDTNAFEELYRITSKRVYFVCMNMLKDEQDANDAMQDTYLTACKSIRQLHDPKSFPSWIERIAINRCKNIIKQKKPVPVDDDMFKETLIEEDELMLPEEYILREDKRKTLLKVMREQLSELQFQTVILYYFSNLSIAEIAEIMECSEGAVKNRLAVSRSKIKKYVDEQEKSTGSKMFVFAGIPFLTKLFSVESESLSVPALNASVTSALSSANKAEKIFKIGRRGVNIMSKKVIGIAAASVAVAAVGIGAVVSFSGNNDKETINDTSSVSVSSLANEPSTYVRDSSVSPIDNTSSGEDIFEKYIYNPLSPEDFEYDGFPELDGHIIDCGGNSGVTDCFLVTDEYKVYHDQYIGGLEYFCTLNGEYEELVPLGGTNEDCLITLNKDGSYTAYYSEGEDGEGYNVTFSIDNLVNYSGGPQGIDLYTLDDGVVNRTDILADGTVKTDHEKVEFDGISNSGYKWYSFYNTYRCFVDNDGKQFYMSTGSNGRLMENLGFGEKVDRFLGGETPTSGFYYTQIGDTANIYYQMVTGEYDLDHLTETFSAPMPEGYTTDDIKEFYCRTKDEVYIETSDGCIFVCSDIEDDGAVFAKEENLSELNQGGYIKAISNYNRMGVGLVGTNNKFYTFHH